MLNSLFSLPVIEYFRGMMINCPEMRLALHYAQAAALQGEVPVGAVIVQGSKVIACAGNRVMQDRDPTAHAEILAIRQAAITLQEARLEQCDLYVTLEPCAMCAQAISLARLRRLYFGAYDPKGGGVDHGSRVFDHATCHHRPEIYGGIHETECGALLKDFFNGLRRL
jgi:tRNA-adenosine deaminase (EC 3.5.4.-)